MAQTDGAPGTTADAGSSTNWDALLQDGVTSTGVDPSQPFTDDGSSAATDPAPQAAQDTSSTGSDSVANPTAPAPAASGDGGAQATTAAVDGAATTEAIPDSKPFTYTVDGQEKAIDGAFVLPGDGLYVPEAKIPHFQLLASRADSLERTTRDLYQQTQVFDRATTWTPTGADKPVSGIAGIQALHTERAQLLAENQAYRNLFQNPENFRGLLTVDPADPDGQRLAFIQDNLRTFLDRVSVQRDRLAFEIGKHFAGFTPQHTAASTAPASGQFDAVAMAPQVVAHAIASAADAASWKSHLTPDDTKWAERLVPRYVRAATAEDAQANPALRVGEPMLEPEFVDLLRDRAKLRESAVTAAKTGTDASKFNGAMTAGRQPPKATAPPKKTTAPARSVPAQKVGKAEAWDQVLQDAMQEIAL